MAAYPNGGTPPRISTIVREPLPRTGSTHAMNDLGFGAIAISAGLILITIARIKRVWANR